MQVAVQEKRSTLMILILAKIDPQRQLIVWDPENQEIIGGYRFYFPEKGCTIVILQNLPHLSYFHFSDKFLSKYYPHLMELGRSFVHPDYQSSGRVDSKERSRPEAMPRAGTVGPSRPHPFVSCHGSRHGALRE